MQNLNAGDQQNLVYLLILLAFLGSSLLLNRSIKFSQILKYLAIWGVLAFIGVALYAYRFEFQDFTSRIKGEINPASAQLEGQKLVINLSRDGHFYLDTKINDKSVRFMIDTGASDMVINIEDAKRVGINPRNLNFNKRYETANGTVFGASVILSKVEVSGVIFENVRASVNGADLGTSLLGMSFLRQFKRYEFYQDKLVLEF